MSIRDRPHWSYSSLNQYLRCPLQFYFQRILKLPQDSTSSSLLLGASVHAALATFHQSKSEEIAVRKKETEEAFAESWVSMESRSTVEYKSGEDRKGVIEQGMALVELYVNDPEPGEPVAIEQAMLIPLRTSDGTILETPLLAYADLIVAEGDSLRVCEFKTSGRAYSENEVNNSLQATCYANAVLECYGTLASIHYTVLVKTKTPKLQRLATARCETDFTRLGDLAWAIETAVQQNVFYPNESPLNCSTCPYHKPCSQWSGSGPKEDNELVQLSLKDECVTC